MVNLTNVGDVSFSPNVRTPGRSAEARGVSNASGTVPGQSAVPSVARGGDSVELSSAARSAGERPIRSDLVERVRKDIASGNYDDQDDKKLDVVADKLAKLFDLRA
jgi:anti-sigma28 factor (negative regulator of flagellin synthesis)